MPTARVSRAKSAAGLKLLDSYTDDRDSKDHPGYIRFAREVEKAYTATEQDFRSIIFPAAAKVTK
jgi:hypothetical protein